MKDIWNKIHLAQRKHVPSKLSAQDIPPIQGQHTNDNVLDFNSDHLAISEVTKLYERHNKEPIMVHVS